MAETKKVAEEKPKNILGKIKEAVDDKEEQLAYLATLIRVIVLVWSAGILTLNYVKIPADQTRTANLTIVDRNASCSSLSSTLSFILEKMPFFLTSSFLTASAIKN